MAGRFVFKNVYIVMIMANAKQAIVLYGVVQMDTFKQHADKHAFPLNKS